MCNWWFSFCSLHTHTLLFGEPLGCDSKSERRWFKDSPGRTQWNRMRAGCHINEWNWGTISHKVWRIQFGLCRDRLKQGRLVETHTAQSSGVLWESFCTSDGYPRCFSTSGALRLGRSLTCCLTFDLWVTSQGITAIKRNLELQIYRYTLKGRFFNEFMNFIRI